MKHSGRRAPSPSVPSPIAGRADPLGEPSRIYRRRLRLTGKPGLVVGEVADDAHHFRVTLRHDDARVLELTGEAVRYPWTTCPAAVSRLSTLHGMPLEARSTAVGQHDSAREHCTHLFDLTGLAAAHAARRGNVRLYDCTVQDDEGGRELATLTRDGAPLIEWRLHKRQIEGPAPFEGVPLRGSGFQAWAEQELEPDLAEAAIVLRRACYVSPVRLFDMDVFDRPSDMVREPGACHTFTEGTKQLALRVKGSQRVFSRSSDPLLYTPESAPKSAGESTPETEAET